MIILRIFGSYLIQNLKQYENILNTALKHAEIRGFILYNLALYARLLPHNTHRPSNTASIKVFAVVNIPTTESAFPLFCVQQHASAGTHRDLEARSESFPPICRYRKMVREGAVFPCPDHLADRWRIRAYDQRTTCHGFNDGPGQHKRIGEIDMGSGYLVEFAQLRMGNGAVENNPVRWQLGFTKQIIAPRTTTRRRRAVAHSISTNKHEYCVVILPDNFCAASSASGKPR